MNVPNPVRPTDPIFKDNWARRGGGHQGEDNQRGYNAHYQDDPNQFVYDQFHRTDSQGNLVQRYICEPERRTLDALGHLGVGNGRWHGIPEERRDIISWNILERWREDDIEGRPRMTFGFYCGFVGNGDQLGQSNHTADGCISLDTKQGTQQFERSFGPWLEMGLLSEVWWDAGSKHDRMPVVLNLLNDQLERYGLHGGTEAIPHTRDNDPATPWPQDISWPQVAPCPLLCLSRFILDRDPQEELAWPSGSEVHVMSTHHPRLDGTSGSLTVAQALRFTKRRWTVGSWLSPGDDNIVNLDATRTADAGESACHTKGTGDTHIPRSENPEVRG